MSLAVVAR